MIMNKYISKGIKLLLPLLLVAGFSSCKKDSDSMEISGKFQKRIIYDYEKYTENQEFNEDGEELVMTYKFDMSKNEGVLVRKGLSLCNCQASPYSKVTVDEKENIVIENVFPENMGGTCNNYFDIYTTIKGVQKKKYHIIIEEGEFGHYEFDIDLSKNVEGKYFY